MRPRRAPLQTNEGGGEESVSIGRGIAGAQLPHGPAAAGDDRHRVFGVRPVAVATAACRGRVSSVPPRIQRPSTRARPGIECGNRGKCERPWYRGAYRGATTRNAEWQWPRPAPGSFTHIQICVALCVFVATRYLVLSRARALTVRRLSDNGESVS